MRNLILILAVIVLAACSSRYSAPVDQIGDGPRFLGDGRTHRVNGGETLYVIAWMYDLDVNALARANGLSAPYSIYPGQSLTVDLRGQSSTIAPQTVTSGTTAGVSISRPARNALPATGTSTGISRTPLPSSTAPGGQATAPIQGPGTPTGRIATPPSLTTARVEAPRPEPVTVSPPATPVLANSDINWGWPHAGNIIGRFSDDSVVGKGMDIAGQAGDRVMAAADGEVVYAGGGLQRYGNLIILKHNDHFLSAYAHNRVLTVTEGQMVTKGQQIAELGSSGIDRNMLHFEIREDGKPVDPAGFMPAR